VETKAEWFRAQWQRSLLVGLVLWLAVALFGSFSNEGSSFVTFLLGAGALAATGYGALKWIESGDGK